MQGEGGGVGAPSSGPGTRMAALVCCFSPQETGSRGRTLHQCSCPRGQEKAQPRFWGLQLVVAAGWPLWILVGTWTVSLSCLPFELRLNKALVYWPGSSFLALGVHGPPRLSLGRMAWPCLSPPLPLCPSASVRRAKPAGSRCSWQRASRGPGSWCPPLPTPLQPQGLALCSHTTWGPARGCLY